MQNINKNYNNGPQVSFQTEIISGTFFTCKPGSFVSFVLQKITTYSIFLAIRVVVTQIATSPVVTTSLIARSTTIAAMITIVINTTGKGKGKDKDKGQYKVKFLLLQ